MQINSNPHHLKFERSPLAQSLGLGGNIVKNHRAPEMELLPLEQSLTLVGGISKNHFYDLIRQGVMPHPVKLSRQCSRWVRAELIAAITTLADKRANPTK